MCRVSFRVGYVALLVFVLVYGVLQTYLQSRFGTITSYHITIICYNVNSIRTHFTYLEMSTDVF